MKRHHGTPIPSRLFSAASLKRRLLHISFAALGLVTSASAEQFPQEEVRFSPDVGQALFPAGNLNIFKQYVLTLPKQSHTIGRSVSIPLGFTSLNFGGSVSGAIGGMDPTVDDAAFGFEVGLCIGGNADFDLGFQPRVILPDGYPTGLPIPITIDQGLLPDSKFTTTFPPLGKAYADLVFEVGAQIGAEACVFGCQDFTLGFSTCDVPGFAVSKRCDPALNAKAYCSFELASFNRDDDNCFRLINVGADSVAEFLAEPRKEYCPSLPDSNDEKAFTANPGDNTIRFPALHPFVNGTQVEVRSSGTLPLGLKEGRVYYARDATATTLRLSARSGGTAILISSVGSGSHLMWASEPEEPEEESGGFGQVSIAVPTVSTDSSTSPYNTSGVLKSSGVEDVMKLDIDVAAIVNAFLPPAPPLSDSGSIGPINWDYTIASLTLGPAVQLQTDFEMTWDLVVTSMTFSNPVNIEGQNVSSVDELVPARTYHLTNSGPNALPAVAMLEVMEEVEVQITYVAVPKLKAIVSLPIKGQLGYEALAVGASIDRIGGLGFGPLIDGAHEFKVGEFTVYEGAPRDLASGSDQEGTVTFTMKADRPAQYRWRPNRLLGPAPTGDWKQVNAGPSTSWEEFLSIPTLSTGYPGQVVDSDFALVDVGIMPTPNLRSDEEVMALAVGIPATLEIDDGGNASATLTVGGGVVENCGVINVRNADSLKLNSPDSVLCGPGLLNLDGGGLLGYTGSGDFTFCNYNDIEGGSNNLMNQRGRNTGSSVINNMGRINLREFSITSADRIINQNQIKMFATSSDPQQHVLTGEEFSTRAGSLVEASGSGASTLLRFNQAEHAGLIRAQFGGLVELRPQPGQRAQWNAGQSLTADVGFFRAMGSASGRFGTLDLEDIDMNGGCFELTDQGAMTAMRTTFSGSMIHVGDFNPSFVDQNSGILTLSDGSATQVGLSNYGTINVPGDFSSSDTRLFANHGRLEIPASGSLSFPMTGPDQPPGISNVAGNTVLVQRDGRLVEINENAVEAGEVVVLENGRTLVGGTWDISGTLDIAGTSITSIGATLARANTDSGSIDDLGGDDRIPSFSVEGDLTRVLSLGNPARVTMRGGGASFPALDSVTENRGVLEMRAGGKIPGTGGSTPGDFTNFNSLFVRDNGSQIHIGGAFIQAGADAVTDMSGGSALLSATDTFLILGGNVVATSDCAIFNRAGSTIPGGTTIRVEAPLLDSDQTDIFTGLPISEPAPVVVDLDGSQTDVVQITNIQAGATVELAGRFNDFSPGQPGVYFPAITFLSSNAGTFRLEGEGFPYSPEVELPAFTNTGEVDLIGSGTRLRTGIYTQNGSLARTRIGAGASQRASDFRINGGEMVIEIGSRPDGGRFGKLDVRNNSNSDFGNHLVFDFTGDFAREDLPSATPDVGDTWELISRNVRTQDLTNFENITVRLNGAPLPSNWGPPGTRFEMVRFDNGLGGLVGLAVRIVPDAGALAYYDWADGRGFAGVLRDPFLDGNDDGRGNLLEFFFGFDGDSRTGQAGDVSIVTAPDGRKFLEMSYVRAQSRDASYIPYYSLDLEEWIPAPMVITAFEDGPTLDAQLVRLQSVLPVSEESLFLRVRGEVNPDNFELGQVAQKPLSFMGNFQNLHHPEDPDQTNWKTAVADNNGGISVEYSFEPGRILFVNVNADADFGSVYGDGTYRDLSNLASAVVHAGLLGDGDSGLVKVTILPRQPSFPASTRNGVPSQEHTYTDENDDPDATSYMLELISRQTE